MSHDGKTGGDIPKNSSKTFKHFLMLPKRTIKCTVIGKRANHGACYGLIIPVNFKFLGPAKAIQWAEKFFKENMSFYVKTVLYLFPLCRDYI